MGQVAGIVSCGYDSSRFHDATRESYLKYSAMTFDYRFASIRGAVGMVLQKAQLFTWNEFAIVRLEIIGFYKSNEHALAVLKLEFVQTAKEGGWIMASSKMVATYQWTKTTMTLHVRLQTSTDFNFRR